MGSMGPAESEIESDGASQSIAHALEELAGHWRLSEDEADALFGRRSTSASEQVERASLLIGIYIALHALHSGELANAWVTLPNTNGLFEGERPAAVFAHGGVESMKKTPDLLEGRRQGL